MQIYENSSKIDTIIGEAANMNVQKAVHYVQSGQAEIMKAVDDGVETLNKMISGLADTDLSNLTATGSAKFDAKQDVILDLSTIRNQAALAATAVQPSDLATVATSGNYDDLISKPIIPTDTGDLTNGAGFITSSAIANMQTTTNLVTSVSSSSTDSQYPSAKLFYDTCGDIETLINAL